MGQPISARYLELDCDPKDNGGHTSRTFKGQMFIQIDSHGLCMAWGTETLTCGIWDPGVTGAQFVDGVYKVPKNNEFNFHVSKIRMMS